MLYHQPVLVREVVESLRPRAAGRYLDATAGGGGHAEAILEACSPDGELLGIDCDEEAIAAAKTRLKKFGPRVHLVRANFAELTEITGKFGWSMVNGVLFDLGISSHQLDRADRGFSFMKEGPLDMRMDQRQTQTAAGLIEEVREEELRKILETFGQERRSRQIARAVVRARARQKLATTSDLAEIISRAVGGKRGRIHPATRAFQAIRIAVNHELANLERGLAAAVKLLAPGGRVAVISFHSGEDGLVKHTFRRLSADCICPPGLPICCCEQKKILRVLTKRPIWPPPSEIATNPHSRSARLRVAERI